MIFMGDAGSMLLGFMLGLLSIMSTVNETTVLSLVVPIFIFAGANFRYAHFNTEKVDNKKTCNAGGQNALSSFA